MRKAWRTALLCIVAALASAACQAGALRYCDAPAELDATQQDRLLRFAAVIKTEVERSGHSLALVARSGLDLSRFQLRYSHAGIALKDNPNAAWSVRQLYYDCDLKQPGIFDQGMTGFVVGTGDPAVGYVSMILLPSDAQRLLERAVLDKALSLQLLGTSYSANAYAFGVLHQNCNQWVAEMLAVAWGGLGAGETREQAQQWLKQNGFEPWRFDIDNPFLMLAGLAVSWLHDDDHPPQPPGRQIFDVSMPASIEAFVRATVPGAQRIEVCHDARQIVVHRGWQALPDGCQATAQDTVIALD